MRRLILVFGLMTISAALVLGQGQSSEKPGNSGNAPGHLFTEDGTPLTAALNGMSASSFKNLTIPAGGVQTLAPRNSDSNDDF